MMGQVTVLHCQDTMAPCVKECPAHVDVPRYCSLIAQGKFAEAVAVIKERIPFPSICGNVCYSPCETKCFLGDIGDPVMIRALKRFAAERDRGYWKQFSIKSDPTGKRVAIIGSGPCGLTAGYYLAKLGHAVTVFEALPSPGGMMRVGIPEYRLPLEVLRAEIDIIVEAGVEIKTNTRVTSIEGCFKQGYDAVLIAIGCHSGNKLNVDGEDLKGVIQGVDFLRQVRLGKKVFLGERVIIVGGGNVAIDAARTARRTGSKEVLVVYRRSREEMPANSEEIEEAQKEEVRFCYLVAPVRIIGEGGKVKAVECCRIVLGEPDASGRLRPIPIEGSQFIVSTDAVILAIGQSVAPSFFAEEKGIILTDSGTLVVDNETLATNVPGVFAGGDAVAGPSFVIDAIAAGRKAAVSIDKYLGGSGIIEELLAPTNEEVVFSSGSWLAVGERAVLPDQPVQERINNFKHLERSLSEEEAIFQARRCLGCDQPMVIDPAACCGCLTCELRCSLRRDQMFNLDRAHIKIRRIGDESAEFMVAVTDECDNCGLCIRYCPYGALLRGRR